MMKKVLISMSILLIIAGLNNVLTAQPQYYNYNTSGSGSNSFPFNITGGKDVQLLYLPGDFNQPAPAPGGNIVSIAFRISPSYPLGPWTYSEFTIKMGQSSITSFTAGSFYTGPLTTVYYRASVVLTGAAGAWMTITLDTPFAYDPTQSLIVDVGQCGVPGATGYSMSFTTLTGNRRLYSVGGCPFAYSSANSAIYHMGINLASSGPPVVTTTAAAAVTGTSATLNGIVNANGDPTTVNFEYGLTTAYGTTVPGVPATVSGTTDTPVSASISGLIPGTTYHYRATGTNANGTANGGDMTFTTLPVLPVAITTGATLVTSVSATLNGTVNAGGGSTTVTFEYGTSTSYGTVVPGVPGTVNGNTATPVSAAVAGLIPNTTYHYRVNGVNSAGTTNGNDMTFFASDCPMPGMPGPITGPTNVCGNSSGNVFSVAPVLYADSYVWAVPPGAVITAGAGSNTITVTFGNTSGNVTVYGVDTCGNGPMGSLTVSVLQAPVPTITGPDAMCINSGYYNYMTEPGMSNYIWTISPGGTITWGQGTNQVQVSWSGSGAQSVNVNYTGPTGCMAGTPTVFPVAVSALPGAAGTITGTAAACGGATGIAYTVAPVADATAYVWAVPAGATIVSGEWTNAIVVDFAPDASSGDITVYGNNVCGNGSLSPPFAVVVTPLPENAGAITGPSSVCAGDSGTGYSVAAIANATGYEWTVPAGATIASGSNTNSITVDFGAGAVSGSITVSGTNTCGNGVVSPDFPVTVNQVPPAPVITLNGDALISDAPEGNQWYLEGTLIPGATGQTFVPVLSGNYTCIVTLNGCSSPVSNEVNVVITGIVTAGSEASVNVYPNPGDGLFTLQLQTVREESFTVQVFNSIGGMIGETGKIDVNGKAEKMIDLRPVANGVYTVLIRSNSALIVKKVVVRN